MLPEPDVSAEMDAVKRQAVEAYQQRAEGWIPASRLRENTRAVEAAIIAGQRRAQLAVLEPILRMGEHCPCTACCMVHDAAEELEAGITPGGVKVQS